MVAVGEWLALVAVFDGCGRESRERCSAGVGGASDFPIN